MESDNLVRLASELLSQLNVSRRVRKAEDIDSSFFVTLYEGLCGDRIPDVIRRTKSKEDEVHNCQCVIDSLAMDVLHTSLSHITGEDIVNHNATAVYNLLEIFSGLMEFILHKIEKECSEDEGRPASTDSAERGLQLATARRSSRDGPLGKENTDKSGSPTSAIAAGVQRVLDEKQMQSPERKRPRIDRDSSAKSSTSRRVRKTPQPLLRPLASSSLQSIVIPSSSDTNYETDTTATGAVSERESRRDANRRVSLHLAATSDLGDAERRRAAPAVDAQLPTKRKPASSDVMHTGSGTASAAVAAAFVAPLPVAADAGGARRDRRDRVAFATSADTDSAATGFASTTVTAAAASRSRVQPVVVAGRSSAASSSQPPLDASRRPVVVASSVAPARGGDGIEDRSRQAAGADRAEGVRHREVSLLADQLAARMLATGESTAELIELANATFTKEEERRWRPSALHVASAGASVKKSSGNSEGSGYPLLGDPQPRSTTSVAATAPSALAAAATSYKPIHSADPRHHDDVDANHRQATSTEESNQKKKTAAQSIRATGSETSAGRATAGVPAIGVAGRWPQHFGSSEPDQCSRDSMRAEATANPATTVDSAAARAAAAAAATLAGTADRLLSEKQEVSSSNLASNRDARLRPTDYDRRAQPTKRHVSFLKDRSSVDETSHVNDTNRRDAESPLWKGLREYVSCLSTSDGATCLGTHSAPQDPVSDGSLCNRSHRKAAADAAAADDAAAVAAVAGGRSGGTGQSASLEPLQRSPTGGGRRLRARQVRFDQSPPVPSSALQTAVTSLERALHAEKKLDERRKLILGKLYRNGLEEAADELRHEAAVERCAAQRRDAAYQRQLRSMSVLKSRNLNVSRKDEPTRPRGFLLPRERIIRPAAACGQSATEQSDRAKTDEKTAVIERHHQLDPEDDAFIPALLDEFPHVDVAPETIRGMWKKHWQAAKLASKAAAEVKRKKSRAQAQMEEAERKQRLLMNIMRKDIAFGQRMRQKKLQANAAKEARRELQERRLKTARVRHYYDEYAVQTRSRMLRSRTKEEQIFKDLFKKGLEIQKQRIRELRSYAKETREARSAEQQLEIEALENYYQDQFNMLTESATKERSEWQLREQAQTAVLNKIKKEMRERMEKEIQRFQDQLLQGEDDAHFRQLDADRIQLQLKLTRLQTGL